MLFMALEDYILEKRVALSWVVDIGKDYKVRLNFELKIDFRGGAKKRNLSYEFDTIRTMSGKGKKEGENNGEESR